VTKRQSSVPAEIRLLTTEWLSPHAREEVHGMLRGLISITQDGEFALEPADRCPRCKVAQALESLFGTQERSFDYISISRPFERAPWMTRESYKSAFQGSLWTVGDILTWDVTRSWLHYEMSAKRKLTRQGKNMPQWIRSSVCSFSTFLVDIFMDSLCNTVADPLETENGAEYGLQLACVLDLLFENLLYFFLATSLTNREELSRFKPFIELLPCCVPLAYRYTDQTRWLVLVR